MVILQEAPNLAQRRHIGGLHAAQLIERDAGALVEFLIEIDGSLGPFHLGRFPNRLAVNQKLQIISPQCPGPGHKHAEDKLSRVVMDGQGDGIFRPLGTPLQLLRPLLHALERQRAAIAILPRPKRRETANAFGLQVPAPHHRLAGEIHRQPFGDGREFAFRAFMTFQAHRPFPAVDHLVVQGDSLARISAPSGREAAGMVSFETQNMRQFGRVLCQARQHERRAGEKPQSRHPSMILPGLGLYRR